jgi:protein-S-isoprenylcysteine O-methyltransferase Ste14
VTLFLMRAAALYLPLALLCASWIWAQPRSRQCTGALLALLWNVPALLALDVLAEHVGWWHFTTEGGALLGLPIDVDLGWIVLWGPLPAIAAPRLPLGWLLGLALAFDLALMPRLDLLLVLGEWWWLGETIGLLVCLLPAQLLARWTAEDSHLLPRVALQVVAFCGLLVGVIPSIALQQSGGDWHVLLDRPVWQLSLVVQALAVPAIVGLAAVQEFAQVGGGTPLPFDPPRRLVSSGPYAYIANPMQLAACVVLIGLGILLSSAWLIGAAVLDILYGLGLAGWHERNHMQARFGDDWQVYYQQVRAWWPRWRPFLPSAILYVDQSCGACSDVGRWLERRAPVGLQIVDAAEYPTSDLERLTYRSTIGGREVDGVAALARALEHLHLGWAFVGWTLRLPLITQIAQLLVDASGGGPRSTSHGRPIGCTIGCSPSARAQIGGWRCWWRCRAERSCRRPPRSA